MSNNCLFTPLFCVYTSVYLPRFWLAFTRVPVASIPGGAFQVMLLQL